MIQERIQERIQEKDSFKTDLALRLFWRRHALCFATDSRIT